MEFRCVFLIRVCISFLDGEIIVVVFNSKVE
jgi:hypothetical protein